MWRVVRLQDGRRPATLCALAETSRPQGARRRRVGLGRNGAETRERLCGADFRSPPVVFRFGRWSTRRVDRRPFLLERRMTGDDRQVSSRQGDRSAKSKMTDINQAGPDPALAFAGLPPILKCGASVRRSQVFPPRIKRADSHRITS